MLIDSHCHLDDKQFDEDRDAAVDRAREAGVHKMVSIGTGDGPPDLEAGIRIADKYSSVYATVGIHPEHVKNATDADLAHVEALLKHPKVVGLGEIGLDYYWKPFDADRQKSIFAAQMEIAKRARKPIIIHTRDAWEDTFALLEQHWAPTGLPCILHCFTGGLEELNRGLALGFYVSFAGIVTYPKAVNVHEAAKAAPLDRMLVETDSPYLAPAPNRGKRNEPAYVVHTARRVAELRGESFESLAAATVSNWQRLFSPADPGA